MDSLLQKVWDGARIDAAEARRLQPHYVESFFIEAFKRLGGSIREREARRFELAHVPAPVRNRDRQIGMGDPVLAKYERIILDEFSMLPPYEMGLLLNAPRSATCSALDTVDVVRIKAADFNAMLANFPDVRATLTKVAVGFISANAAALIRPVVSGVRAQASTI